MRNFFISLSTIILSFPILTAQNPQTKCPSNDVLKMHLQKNPELRTKLTLVEEQITRLAAAPKLRTRNVEITVPVVVHIVYRTTGENISDAQVRSQIDAMNLDFNKENSDAVKVPAVFNTLAADCDIRFQLAAFDPQGTETYGIVRHYSSQLTWGVSDDIKMPSKGGFAPWNPAKYLNIWVCNMGGKSIGFASFPGMPAEYDGIVIDYRAFGTTGTAKAPYNMGRTCVHEVGHWLGLYHIWGDSKCGDDHVQDTPAQEADHKGAPSFPQYSTCGGNQTVDMFMNYMDYVNDDAMFMFTIGQKNRMNTVLTTHRASLLQSTALQAPLRTVCSIQDISIKTVQATTASIAWETVAGVKQYTLEYKAETESTWKSISTSTPSFMLSNLTIETTYECRVKTDCNTATYSKVGTFTTKNNPSRLDAQAIQMSPNPVTDVLSISMNGETLVDAKVSILDASGQVKFEKIYTTAPPSVQFDMSNLASGMYMVVIQKDNSRVVKKIMKVQE